MPRQWDADQERLPNGFTRAGYDADEQVHYFRDEEGQYWESEPGAHRDPVLSELRRSRAEPTSFGDNDEVSTLLISGTSPGYIANRQAQVDDQSSKKPRDAESWRAFAPFALLLLAFMALMIWYIRSPSTTVWTGGPPKQPSADCTSSAKVHVISDGETCWSIAKDAFIHLEDLMKANPKLDCGKLNVRQEICVPIKS